MNSIIGLAHTSAQTFPDHEIWVGDERITHAGLDALGARYATQFKTGDRVLLAAPVSMRWLGAYLGILRAGAVAALANPACTKAELDQLIDAAEPHIVLRKVEPPDAEPEPWIERTEPDDVAVLAFTSGTTGKPKGVPLTHRNLVSSIRGAMQVWGWSADDVLVHALPLFHQHGLGGLHATLIAGSSLHLLARFDPVELPREIERSRATVLFAVPTMYQRLSGLSKNNNLRLCVSGSAPLSPSVAEHAREVLGQTPLVRYGTTESGLDTSQPLNERYPGTVGVPLPSVDLRLGDDGEIQLRGPQVFGGYWREPEATAAAFTPDGWFRTGDVGHIDEATGHLVIDGRIKEMIITGGMKVYPREVELALERHPDVVEAAVTGVASERWGEQVTAWVVIKPGATFDAAALIAHTGDQLAPYKRPKEIRRVDALPRNHVGKIDRRQLR